MAINYFTANPDVAEAYSSYANNYTPQEFADLHYSLYGEADQRAAPIVLDLVSQGNLNPTQIAAASGIPVNQVIAQVATTVPQGQATLIGDTWVQPNYQVTGSGMDQQIGGIDTISVYKTTGGVNDQVPVGTKYQQYNADGTFQRTGTTQAVSNSLAPFILGSLGLFGGLGGGFDSLFGGPAAGNGAFLGEGVLSGVPAFDAAFLNAGGTFNPAFLPPVTTPVATPPVGTPPVGTPPVAPPVGTPPVAPPVGTPPVAPPVVPPVIPPIGTPPVITPLITSLLPTAVNNLLTPTNLGNLLTSGATTAGGLLQQQTSAAAATAAQAKIDTETAAAKTAAAFKPIGMTTRFGTSQFQTDPVTGRLTSAGYTLSPEAKAQQDRFVALSNAGLTQAEAAQQAFKPLQTGATNLFALGNKYLAETPEKVAENYLKSQMALLQPGRELELANLQNRLQQQGRGGLSVAQGGTMGATTPELQALFNARAQQEAVLAANAQQAGQQQVLYGAGLLGQGTTAMGNYYAGQQGAYAPYTTAMGQVTGLEALGQQPFGMSTGLAQQYAQAGANVGQLGLRGAEQSVALATGRAATTNPYSTLLGGFGASPALNAAAGNLLGGLFGGTPTASLTAGFTPGLIAATEAGYPSLYSPSLYS